MQLAYFLYHVADNNVFETCLKTLRKHCSSCKILVTTDNVPVSLRKSWSLNYGVEWDVIPESDYKDKGAFCKIKRMQFLFSSCSIGEEIAVLDADLYFLGDPFLAFKEFSTFNLGLTTRCHEYHFKINGGVFYFRWSLELKDWLDFHVEESFSPKWIPYVAYRKKFDHERFGLDWTVGQDFLNVCWQEKKFVEEEFGICIQDVGCRFNYCPAADKLGKEEAEKWMMKAFHKKSAVVLHLKSEFKNLIYRKKFPDCVLSNPIGTLCWARKREEMRAKRRKESGYVNWRDKK